MKKIFTVLITLVLALTMLLPCNAAGVSSGGGGAIGGGTAIPSDSLVTMNFSNVTMKAGTENISVNLLMSVNDGCTSIHLEVLYDEDVLTLTGVTDNGVFSGANHSDNYTSPYILSWENDYAKENITTTGNLVTLSFAVDTDAPAGSYPIYVKNAEVLDADMNFVDCIVTEGIIKFIGDEDTLNVDHIGYSENYAILYLSLWLSDPLDGTVLVASYDENGRMISLQPFEAQSRISGIFVDIENADHINIMWWDMSNLRPVVNCQTININ